MKQSHRMSMIESVANVTIGYSIALVAQIIIYPLFGIYVGFGTQIKLGIAFTGVSMARSYILRRLFNELHHRGIQ